METHLFDLPYAWSHILRLFIISAVVIESGLCCINSCIQSRIVLITRGDSLRQSFELYAVACAVIYERSVVDPAHLRHVVGALADGPLMLTHYKRFVEIILIKIEADRRSVCAGFNSHVSGVFRHHALRQSLQPYMLFAAVIGHVIFFCPAYARYIYICSFDVQSHGV